MVKHFNKGHDLEDSSQLQGPKCQMFQKVWEKCIYFQDKKRNIAVTLVLDTQGAGTADDL